MVQSTRQSVTDVHNPEERFRINDDVAIITGSANGLGRVVAFTLAAAGAEVILVDRDKEGLQEVATELSNGLGIDPAIKVVDITDETAVQTLASQVTDQYDTIDILVNAAGITTRANPDELGLDTWNLILNVNLTGTFLCCREFFPRLEGGGRIVNFASTAGIYGYGEMVHYAASKSGVMNLTRSLARSWVGDNVRVNAIAPGWIYTDHTADQLSIDAKKAYDRETIDRGVGSPSEIADTVLFLVSQASSYITGETLTISGSPPDQSDVHPDGEL